MLKLYSRTFVSIFILMGGVFCKSFAGVADPPVVSTADNPTYYVIMNVANRQFLYFNKEENLSANRKIWTTERVNSGNVKIGSSTVNYHPDNYLWYFEADGNNYKIATKGPKTSENIYLDKWNILGSHYYIQDFTSTGVAWGIEPYPYSQLGVCIQSKIGGSIGSNLDGYWYAESDTYTYVQRQGLSSSNPDYYTFVLYSYDDLLAEAAAQGIDTSAYAAADKTSGASFQTLVNAIVAKKAEKNVPAKADGNYLLRNRRYGLFLSANGTSLIGSTNAVTDYSVWAKQVVGGVTYFVSRANAEGGTSIRATVNGDNAVWNLSASDAYNATIQSSSDGDQKYVSFLPKSGATNGYLGMNADGSLYARPSSGYTSDWEMIPVTTDAETGKMSYTLDGTTHTIANPIASEDELIPEDEDPLKAKYFRLQNATRSVESYAADRIGGGGWLEDVDKMHFTYRIDAEGVTADTYANPKAFGWNKEEAILMHSAKDVPFYAAELNTSHASALWEFVLIGRGSANEENATGLISPEHNIYSLRNANTGAYIKNVSDVISQDSRSFLKTTDNKNDALKFYLAPLVDGQWAINVYGSTTGGTDAANGYLYIDGQADGYRGGLTWTTTGTPAADSQSAWIITEAPTLELPLLVKDLVHDPDDDDYEDQYDWTTFYYPFDVTLSSQNSSSQNVDFFVGEWRGTYVYNSNTGTMGGYIKMTKIDQVPGGTAVFIRSSKSYGKVVLNVAPKGNVTADETALANNVWKGVIETGDEATSTECPNYFGANWRNYWVLSKNNKGYIRLLHPAADYLLPNRAYLDAETTSVLSNGAKFSGFNLFISEPMGETTGINSQFTIPNSQFTIENGAPAYNLAGQRVDKNYKGIVIVNGRKRFVK